MSWLSSEGRSEHTKGRYVGHGGLRCRNSIKNAANSLCRRLSVEIKLLLTLPCP